MFLLSPVVPILCFVRRQAQHLSLGIDTQPGDRTIGVSEISRHLVDFEDFTIPQASGFQGLDVGTTDRPRLQG